MKGRTVVITGGTSGIGFHTAVAVAKRGARVIVTGRSRERGETGVRAIREASGSEQVELVLGDLTTLGGMRALAVALEATAATIDVLVNNAGSLTTTLQRTSDDVETNFAVNVLAPYVLTSSLTRALEAARPARVINVSGGLGTGDLDVDDLQAEKGFTGLMSYSHTKRAMEAMSVVLARELEPRGIYVNVVLPGSASTAMTRAMTRSTLPWWMKPLWPVFRSVMQRDDGGASAEKASRSSSWAVEAVELVRASGQIYDARCKRTRFKPKVADAACQQRVVALLRRYASASPLGDRELRQ